MKRAKLFVNQDCRSNALVARVGEFGDSHAMTAEEIIRFAAARAAADR